MEYQKNITKEIIEKILAKGVRDMPQNPASQGYSERQIRAFYYVPESEILELVKSLEESVANAFNSVIAVEDVVNNLDSQEEGKPLSAKQGKILKGLIEELKQTNATIKIVLVDVLPTEGETNIVYLVPNTNSQDKNIKDEYLWIDNKWELIGSTAIDLTEYQKKTDNSLETESKEIVGAINEVNKKAGQGGGGGITDVQDTNGTSFVENGVAKIPVAEADSGKAGLAMVGNGNNTGISIDKTTKLLKLNGSTESMRQRPKSYSVAVLSSSLYSWIKYGIVQNDETLTAEEKANAQKWLGVEGLHTYSLTISSFPEYLYITTKGKANVSINRLTTDDLTNFYISCDKEIVSVRIDNQASNFVQMETNCMYIGQRVHNYDGTNIDTYVQGWGITHLIYYDTMGEDMGSYKEPTLTIRNVDFALVQDAFYYAPDLLSIPFEEI